MKKHVFFMAVILLLSSNYRLIFAHCDTQDGPVIKDARIALEHNNVNYALKWVQPASEKEIIAAFILTMKVRGLSQEAKELADRYFFETLVRVHRAGEGVPYTGIKPAGTPIDEKIKAADKSIETGSLTPLENIVPEGNLAELRKRFDKVMSLKNFDVNDVPKGREYIEAYVQFFHFAEDDTKESHGHIENAQHQEQAGHIH